MDHSYLKVMIDLRKKEITSQIKTAYEFLGSMSSFMEIVDNLTINKECSLENMCSVLTKLNDFSSHILQVCVILEKIGIWIDNANCHNIKKWFDENCQINLSNGSFESQNKMEEYKSCNNIKFNSDIESKAILSSKQINEVSAKQSSEDRNLNSDKKHNLLEPKTCAPIELKIQFDKHGIKLQKFPLKMKEIPSNCRVSLPEQQKVAVKDEFKCIITHIFNPVSFYVHPDFYSEKKNEIRSTFQDLDISNAFMSKSKVLNSNIEYFVIENCKEYYRATLCDLLPDSKNELQFFLLDVGEKLTVHFKSVFPLPFELYNYPPLAYHCFLDIVKPLPENKGIWSLDAIKFFQNYLHKKCSANISKISINGGLGLILIHEDLVINMELEFQDLAIIHCNNIDENVKNMSTEKGDVDNVSNTTENNDIVGYLKNIQINYKDDDLLFVDEGMPLDYTIKSLGCDYKDKIFTHSKELPETCFKGSNFKKSHQHHNIDAWTIEKKKFHTIKEHDLPNVGDVINIFITAILNFRKFYAHIISLPKENEDCTYFNQDSKSLEAPCMAKIMAHLNSSLLLEFTHYPAIDDYVATNISGLWYRARVVSILDKNTVKVFLIDYGHTNDVDLKDIRKLDNSHTSTPKQAVEFEIEDIELKNHDNLFHTQNELSKMIFKKRLTAIVKRIEDNTVIIKAFNDDGFNISELLWGCGYVEIFKHINEESTNTIYIPG